MIHINSHLWKKAAPFNIIVVILPCTHKSFSKQRTQFLNFHSHILFGEIFQPLFLAHMQTISFDKVDYHMVLDLGIIILSLLSVNSSSLGPQPCKADAITLCSAFFEFLFKLFVKFHVFSRSTNC